MHNTLFNIVTHLGGGAFSQKTSIIVFLLYLYVRQLLFVNVIIDIEISYVDNRDNFVANIKIYFLALSHTPNVNVLILSS